MITLPGYENDYKVKEEVIDRAVCDELMIYNKEDKMLRFYKKNDIYYGIPTNITLPLFYYKHPYATKHRYPINIENESLCFYNITYNLKEIPFLIKVYLKHRFSLNISFVHNKIIYSDEDTKELFDKHFKDFNIEEITFDDFPPTIYEGDDIISHQIFIDILETKFQELTTGKYIYYSKFFNEDLNTDYIFCKNYKYYLVSDNKITNRQLQTVKKNDIIELCKKYSIDINPSSNLNELLKCLINGFKEKNKSSNKKFFIKY
jgi:hypothetical protein